MSFRSSVEARFASERRSWIVRISWDEMGFVRVAFGALDVE